MKKNTILFMLIAALAILISSCDSRMPLGGKHDGGEGGRDDTGNPRSSAGLAVNVSIKDSNTLAFYFREPAGTVMIAIENSDQQLLTQQEVNTSDTALAEIDITDIDTGILTIKITDTRNNIIYREIYNME